MIYIYIPAYNEEDNIGAILEETLKTMSGAEVEYRVIVVNDASTDRTSEILESFRDKMPLEILTHEQNQNQGGALRTGLGKILEEGGEEDFVVTLDADSAHQPSNIIDLYDKLLDAHDVVIASRYRPGGEEWGAPRWRKYLARTCNWLIHLCFPIEEVSDYTGSFRGYRLAALRRAWGKEGVAVLKEKDFTVVPEMLICLRGKGLSFYEIPLIVRYDLKRGQKTKLVVSKVLKATLRLIYRRLVGDRPGRKK